MVNKNYRKKELQIFESLIVIHGHKRGHRNPRPAGPTLALHVTSCPQTELRATCGAQFDQIYICHFSFDLPPPERLWPHLHTKCGTGTIPNEKLASHW